MRFYTNKAPYNRRDRLKPALENIQWAICFCYHDLDDFYSLNTTRYLLSREITVDSLQRAQRTLMKCASTPATSVASRRSRRRMVRIVMTAGWRL